MKNDRGFTLIELVIVIVILAMLACIIVPQFLALPDPPVSAAPVKPSVQSFTGSGQWGGNIFIVEFDSHLLMVSSGGILHHPDCVCLSVTEDRDE